MKKAISQIQIHHHKKKYSTDLNTCQVYNPRIIMPSNLGEEPGGLDSLPRVFTLLFLRKAATTALCLRSCGLRFFLILVCHRYSSFLHIHNGLSRARGKAPQSKRLTFWKLPSLPQYTGKKQKLMVYPLLGFLTSA